jgi:hypothetical protein
MVISQKKTIKKIMLRIAFTGIFFTAACMHLLYSPHHQNLSDYRSAADFKPQPSPCNRLSPHLEVRFSDAFPIDFELPEPDSRPLNINVRPYLDFLHQFEILSANDAFLHRHQARPPPC